MLLFCFGCFTLDEANKDGGYHDDVGDNNDNNDDDNDSNDDSNGNDNNDNNDDSNGNGNDADERLHLNALHLHPPWVGRLVESRLKNKTESDDDFQQQCIAMTGCCIWFEMQVHNWLE